MGIVLAERNDSGAGDRSALSFDPKTWREPGIVAPDPTPAAEPNPTRVASAPNTTPATPATPASFDPRTWRATPTELAAAMPPSAPPAPAGKIEPGALPWRVIAVGALTLVITVVGFAMFSRRAAAPKVAAGPTAAASRLPVSTLASLDRRVLTIAGAAGLGPALAQAGVDPLTAATAATAAAPALASVRGELRLELTLRRADSGPVLERLQASGANGAGAVLTRTGDGFAVVAQAAALTTRVVARTGQLDNESFYTSAVAAGVADALIPAFAQAFAFDFDFQREIHKGDVFEAVWEEDVNPQGEAQGALRLLYVALTTAAKSRALYRFTPPGGEPGWYDGVGRSVKRGFMRTPVDGARISSSFGWRTHPIQGFLKLHKGIDFAAPTGTPIYAAGDGVVAWAAEKGPNGNLGILKHDNGWQTYYLHMSAYGAGVTPGARLRQGQEVGLVGTTGNSTGPHLHYELHVEGQAVDPASVKLEEGQALSGAALAAFKAERDRVDAARATAV